MEAISSLLRSAERLLAKTGDAVALCPVYGEPRGRGGVVSVPEIDTERRTVLRCRVRLLVAATITYNLVEAVVALAAGTVAGSVALIGFGLDSLVEVTSAAAVAWQFAARDPQRRERVALGWWWADPVAALALAAVAVRKAAKRCPGSSAAPRSQPAEPVPGRGETT